MDRFLPLSESSAGADLIQRGDRRDRRRRGVSRHERRFDAIFVAVLRRFSIIDANGILLVEDNPSDVELTQRALRKAGVDRPIRTASDGVEALEMLFGGRNGGELWRPSLILLDLKLPKVGGLEVLDAIKRDESTRSIPTIVLTSSRELADVSEAYRLGANSYVVKPVEFDQFTATIARLAAYWIELNEWA
jgi:two-component system response regulator